MQTHAHSQCCKAVLKSSRKVKGMWILFWAVFRIQIGYTVGRVDEILIELTFLLSPFYLERVEIFIFPSADWFDVNIPSEGKVQNERVLSAWNCSSSNVPTAQVLHPQLHLTGSSKVWTCDKTDERRDSSQSEDDRIPEELLQGEY